MSHTFLEIAQTVDKILGTQGNINTVESPDYHVLLAEHVRNSWVSIQNLRQDWEFLRTSVDVNLTVGKIEYTTFDIFGVTADPVGKWDTRYLLYDKDPLIYVDYNNYILEDWDTDSNEPKRFTFHKNSNHLYFNTPDKAYTVTAYYYQKPQVLKENTDTIICPDEFIYAVIYKTCASIGMYLGIPEIYQYYSVLASQEIGAMMRKENPGKEINVRGIV